MSDDFILIATVSLVWAALAALYAFVPMFAMPGGAFIWGSGALVFLGLAAAIAAAGRYRRAM
jgi:hypothetical protein